MATKHLDIRSKTTLVTGANSGIGLAIAMGIAKQGARVLMVCRSVQRGAEAQDLIEAKSGNASVHLLIAACPITPPSADWRKK